MEPSAPPHPALRTSTSLDFQHHAASTIKNDYSTSSRSVSDRFSRIPFTSISNSSSPLRDLFQPPSSSFRFPSTPTVPLQQNTRESPSPTDTIRPSANRAPSPPTRSHSSLSVSSRRGPLPPHPTLAPPPISLPPALHARASTSQLRQSYMNPSIEEDWRGRGLSGRLMEPEDSPVLPTNDGERQARATGGGGESIPGYDTNEDPFSDDRAAGGGGEKNRLMEVRRARRGEGGGTREEDSESSRSAEMGSRDHLERWRNEQTNLDAKTSGNNSIAVGSSSVSDDMRQRDARNQGVSAGMERLGFRGGGSLFDGNPLAGMSDAEIAQHHFRLAQQHLEAAQRLAMAASVNPAPSAPPSSSHDHSQASIHYSGAEEDVFPPSSSSSHTEYPESSFGDSVESQISSQLQPQYPSTYSQAENYPVRHESSREGLYSEFGTLNLEGTKPLFDGKRSRSLSNSNPPLSSVSEKPPPLPLPSIPLVDSKSIANHSKFSSLPSSKSQAQQYPARMTSNTSLQSPARRRPSTADQVTPRAVPRQTIRRPSTTDHARAPPAPQIPLPPLPSSQLSYEERPTMVPSLYGGTLPRGMQDRIGTIPHPPQSTHSSASSSSRSDHLAPHYDRQRTQYMEDVFEYESILDGGGGVNSDGSYQELDGFDSASDYHDVQSTISHVTNATLPPYEYERRLSQISASPPPPVPSIPQAFRPRDQPQYSTSSIRSHGSISSAATLVNSGHQQYRNPSSNEGDEFHGFRPRLGTGHSQPQTFAPSTPYPNTESAQWIPTRQDQARAQAQSDQIRLFAPDPSLSDTQMQPHSYILGADGRPIPVYASLPPPAPPLLPQHQSLSTATSSQQPSYFHSSPLPAVNRQPLPIHSQPLQFDHSLHINPSRQNVAQRPTLSIPSSHPPTSSVSPSSSFGSTPSHAYHLPPPSTFTQPQPQIQIRSTSTTPSSTSSGHSSIAATSPSSSSEVPPSIMPFMKRNRLVSSGMSLRRMVRSPHVRFKSPEPSIAETSNSKYSKSDKVTAVGGGGEGESSSKDERNQKAMQQSLGMLM
ncbi:hypothetical protein JCM3765_004414 [Sporobolomyces pararoseus]